MKVDFEKEKQWEGQNRQEMQKYSQMLEANYREAQMMRELLDREAESNQGCMYKLERADAQIKTLTTELAAKDDTILKLQQVSSILRSFAILC